MDVLRIDGGGEVQRAEVERIVVVNLELACREGDLGRETALRGVEAITNGEGRCDEIARSNGEEGQNAEEDDCARHVDVWRLLQERFSTFPMQQLLVMTSALAFG